MSDTAERYETIERYLRGELSDTERAAFEAILAKDPDLRAELDLHRELEETFGDPEYDRLLGLLREADAASPQTPAKTQALRAWRWWIGMAAAVLAVLAVGAAIFIRTGPASAPEELFAQYFTPYPADAFRAADTPAPELPEAIATYRAGRFAETIRQIESMPPAAATPLLRFYYGVALLGDGQGTRAALIFEELIGQENLSGLAQPLQWYLALASLQSGDLAKARTLLAAVAADEDHYQREKAAALLREI